MLRKTTRKTNNFVTNCSHSVSWLCGSVPPVSTCVKLPSVSENTGFDLMMNWPTLNRYWKDFVPYFWLVLNTNIFGTQTQFCLSVFKTVIYVTAGNTIDQPIDNSSSRIRIRITFSFQLYSVLLLNLSILHFIDSCVKICSVGRFQYNLNN